MAFCYWYCITEEAPMETNNTLKKVRICILMNNIKQYNLSASSGIHWRPRPKENV